MITVAMRRFLVCVVVALAFPAAAQAKARVVAFYYPWYGTTAIDGTYQHWSQNAHSPPYDIASSYYPARGLYSSSDKRVIAGQMDDIRSAGIDEIAVSWWGKGSAEDQRLQTRVMAAAARTEDSVGGAPRSHTARPDRPPPIVALALCYLRAAGIRTFYVYRAPDYPAADWRRKAAAPSGGGVALLADCARPLGAAAGFDGHLHLRHLTAGGDKFARLCSEARALHLLCAQSVGPGYPRPPRYDGDPQVKPRRNGRAYDAMGCRNPRACRTS